MLSALAPATGTLRLIPCPRPPYFSPPQQPAAGGAAAAAPEPEPEPEEEEEDMGFDLFG